MSVYQSLGKGGRVKKKKLILNIWKKKGNVHMKWTHALFQLPVSTEYLRLQGTHVTNRNATKGCFQE